MIIVQIGESLLIGGYVPQTVMIYEDGGRV